MNMRKRKKKVPDATDISLKTDKPEAYVKLKMHKLNPTVISPKENSSIPLHEEPPLVGTKKRKVGQSKENPNGEAILPTGRPVLSKPNLIRLVPNECLVDSAPKETEAATVDYEVKKSSILQSTLKVIYIFIILRLMLYV